MEKHQLSTMIAGLSLPAAIIFLLVPVYAGDNEDLCEDNGGNWEDGMCDIDDEKSDSYLDDIEKFRAFEEDRAADEDALCDDPDAKFDICNPTGRDDKVKDDDDDKEFHTFKYKQGDNEVTAYYKDEDKAKEAYENLDKDELTHSDKSFSDWEYDDEEHPSLD